MERGRERREGPTRSGFGKYGISAALRSFMKSVHRSMGVVYQRGTTCPIIAVFFEMDYTGGFA
jgi:hypothetical protein